MVKQPKQLNGTKGQAEMLKALRPLSQLETLYRAFDKCEAQLVKNIGVPICIEHCGKCCQVTTPDIWEVEARFMVSSLIGSSGKLDKIAGICEDWLISKDPELKTYGMPAKQLSEEEWDRMRPELNHILLNSPCPFLTEEKGCSVHDVRALVCRCYGVTRVPSPICPRPLSKMEAPDIRAHVPTDSPVAKNLRRMLWEVLRSADEINWAWTYFQPTILYMILKPEKFQAHVADGRIPSAKLLRLRTNTALIFQEELNEVWARETPALMGGEKPCRMNL